MLRCECVQPTRLNVNHVSHCSKTFARVAQPTLDVRRALHLLDKVRAYIISACSRAILTRALYFLDSFRA